MERQELATLCAIIETMTNFEDLPFTVRIATSVDDLRAAASVRCEAYGRHLPELARELAKPEAMDSATCAMVLLARGKVDGEPVGTIRIQTNGSAPLALEQSITLPDWLLGAHLAEATRLALLPGSMAQSVKAALFKAFFQVCEHQTVGWMVIAGRQPVDRMYERLMFKDVLEKRRYIPLAHASNIPHRIMALEIKTARRRWTKAKHPLLGYVIDTIHPDIDLSAKKIHR